MVEALVFTNIDYNFCLYEFTNPFEYNSFYDVSALLLNLNTFVLVESSEQFPVSSSRIIPATFDRAELAPLHTDRRRFKAETCSTTQSLSGDIPSDKKCSQLIITSSHRPPIAPIQTHRSYGGGRKGSKTDGGSEMWNIIMRK